MCTGMGCTTGIFMDIGAGEFRQGDQATVELCLDETCARAAGPLSATHGLDGKAQAFGKGSYFHVWLQDGVVTAELHIGSDRFNDNRPRRLTFSATGEGGQEPVEHDQDVRMQRVQPNGPACEPVCWFASVQLA